jgi:hypothetical protein
MSMRVVAGRCLFLVGFLSLSVVASVFASSQDSVVPSSSTPPLLLAEASTTTTAAPTEQTVRATGPTPGMAVTLALAPGVVVHGAGHFYAGRPLVGAALLAAELGSLYLIYRGGTSINSAINNGAVDAKSANFGESEEFSRGAGWAAAGVAVFLASWFFDLTGAPIAAGETAAAKAKAAEPSLTIKPQFRADRAGVIVEQRF